MMKTLLTTLAAAVLATSFAMPATAAKKQQTVADQRQASCKAQAAKRYSVVHFLARRDYVKRCMGETAAKKAKPAHKKAA
jgi:hypothetical protein